MLHQKSAERNMNMQEQESVGKKVEEKDKNTGPEQNRDGLLAVRIGYAAVPAGQGCSSEQGTEDMEQLREVSGDTAVSCRLPDGSIALILSDGMGKGEQAAAESSLVVGMLRRRLKQGMPVDSAIREVNRYLLEGGKKGEKKPETAGVMKESFATVDLAIIDRSTGRARFYKMGAAPSYVVRGRKEDSKTSGPDATAAGLDGRPDATAAGLDGRPDARAAIRAAGSDVRMADAGIDVMPRRVRKLAKPALPVGIIPTLKLTHVTARLHAGDLIVMMSDGITDMAGLGNDDWIEQMLSGVPTEEGPRQLASRILREGQQRCVVRETDDATVMVAIIR